MPTLCEKCPKRDACTELCKKAERYVNQDYVRQKEKLVGTINYYPSEQELPKHPHLTSTERKILTLLGQGLTRGDVCQILEMSRGTLRVHITNLKRKS